MAPLCATVPGQMARGVFVQRGKGPALIVPPDGVANELVDILKRFPPQSVSSYVLRSTACPDATGTGKSDCSKFFMFAIEAPKAASDPATLDFMFRRDASGISLIAVFSQPINAYPEVAGGAWSFRYGSLHVPEDWWFQPVR